ncbi:MAG: response regulator [Flammeovirgaceae bacterium]|nr:response regulator [Flammeovirgaceae bacterium]MBE61924.1 response regulator [Flammeovirgaceae bacterium]HCX23300.1 response regulator [Cytophagales bacterium]|tara:strand:+ start:10435 stop:10812 length:378 start_codon:yes stop_codon:yes gene_type:complete
MSNHKILLAEPNELLRKVLTDRLRIDGFEVKAVVNGQELIEEMEDQVDLIITEELLPFRSGFEILEIAQQKKIPVIIISDADLEAKILEAFRLGASDFIDKPFSPNEVVARAKNILMRINATGNA